MIDWGCAKYGDFLYDVAMFDFWQFWYPSMNGIDYKMEAKHFFEKQGISVPNFEERIQCYQLHIGLDSMAYCAFRKNWKYLKLVSERIQGLL